MTLLSDVDGSTTGVFDTGMTREDAGFPVPFGVLSPQEREERDRCESIIDQSLRTFVEVGEALMAIRERRLYLETHQAFDGYCLERFDFQKAHAYRLIAAAEVVANLSPIGDKPSSESQARPLSNLSPDQQREAWQRAVETAPNGKVTAAHVESVARQYREHDASPGPKEWTLDDAQEYLGSKLYEISQRWPSERIEVMAHQLRSLADELLEFGELRQ